MYNFYNYQIRTKVQEAKQCKMEIDRTILYCGIHTFLSCDWIVAEYICRLCQTLVANNYMKLVHYPWETDHFRSITNSTITSSNVARSITVNGLLWNLIDPYGIWDNGIVQVIIKIVFKDYEVLIKRASLQLILSSGQRCDTRWGECLNSENGQTFWLVVFQDTWSIRNFIWRHNNQINS